VHFGIGATVGSVIATKRAVVPAAVGVDIGCGMMAVQTTLQADDLPDSLGGLRARIERAVPHGFESVRGRSVKGSWAVTPDGVLSRWKTLADRLDALTARYPKLDDKRPHTQLGTLGGGNHFIEVCLDEAGTVWVMLHSGSRGIGNRIGQHFIELARNEMSRLDRTLPDRNLAYFTEGTARYDDYVEAMTWAQDYAAENRRAMRRARSSGVRWRSTAITTTARRSGTSAKTCSSPARARCAPGAASSGSSRDRWARARTSCAASARRTASRAAAMARAGRCRGPRRASASRSKTMSSPPRGWSAARTPG
jgi:hypothetical protein